MNVIIRFYLKTGIATVAGVIIYAIDALSLIHAGWWFAFVDVDLTISTEETRRAHTCVRCYTIYTLCPIVTRIAVALVHVYLAGFTGVTRLTYTLKHVDAIEARSIILAWAAQALVDVDITMIAGEARPAEAVIATLGIDTNSIVTQGITVQLTLVHIEIAILTYEW